MLSRVRKYVTYTNVAVTLGVVFAMSGGAFAATKVKAKSKKGGVVITSTTQISPSVLKKLIGKTGPQGPAGPAGPGGSAGAQGNPGGKGENGAEGPAGKEGAVGPAGTTGKDGASGESPTMKEFSGVQGKCEEGGVEFVLKALKNLACNGLEGPEGPAGKDGSPWPVNGTLPVGSSEKGMWGTAGAPGPAIGGLFKVIGSPISFNIPLAKEPVPHIIAAGEKITKAGEGCPVGSSFEKPEAESGNVCIFVKESEDALGTFPIETTDEGVMVWLSAEEGVTALSGRGTWAVTG